MKIAVITYHYSNNKGAFMQAYALCKFLRDQGHDLRLIDVRQEEDASFGIIGKVVKGIIVGRRLNRDINNYYPPFTRRYYSSEELRDDPPIADCYIVGSDQVWNPNISKDLMLSYFLDFGPSKTKRVSYASSFGLAEWNIKNDETNEHIRNLLHSFDALSVREIEGQQLCEREFGLLPVVVLDPTFLNDDYSEIIGTVKPRKEILCYKINKTNDFWENAPKLSKQMNLPLALLNYNFPHKGFKYIFPPTLKTWMRRIASAEFVVTDSFHGVAFSILNKKQFAVTLNHNDRDSRLINIIHQFSLEDRLYDSVEEMIKDKCWEKKINYSSLDEIVSIKRKDSQDFLIKALDICNR